MGGHALGRGSTVQSLPLSPGNATCLARGAWEDDDGGGPTTGRKLHLQSGGPRVIRPVFTGYSSPLSAHALLPETQKGPPGAPGTFVPPAEASGPWSHLPRPAKLHGARRQPLHHPRRWLGTPVPGSGRLLEARVTDHCTQPPD